ncbi:LysR substrate-binding domain-containing protein [Fusobacterium sp. THCT1E2]
MNIRHLHIFKAVCDEMNFTRAAEKLYMTQPAVSHVINDLEEETGHILFDRISKKIYLTEMGKIFLNKTLRILELYNDLENNFYSSEKDVPICIGSCITIGNFWLPSIIKKFKKVYPETPLKIQIDSAAAIEKMLLNNSIDIALIEGGIHNENLIKTIFSSYELSVICSAHHPFSKKKSISIEEFIKEDLLLREKGSAIRDCLDNVLAGKDIFVAPSWTSTNSQALIQGVKNNLGITVLPDILVANELEKKELKKLFIENIKLNNNNYIVHHKDKHISNTMSAFIESAKQTIL